MTTLYLSIVMITKKHNQFTIHPSWPSHLCEIYYIISRKEYCIVDGMSHIYIQNDDYCYNTSIGIPNVHVFIFWLLHFEFIAIKDLIYVWNISNYKSFKNKFFLFRYIKHAYLYFHTMFSSLIHNIAKRFTK